MLIEAAAAMVLRCAKCGKLALVAESLFDLRRGGKEVHCPCGGSLVRLDWGRRGFLHLEIMCFNCGDWHFIPFSLVRFWRRGAEYFRCPASQLKLALTGPLGLLRERLAAGNLELMGFSGDLNLEELFREPDIMFQIIHYLYELGRAGRISCRCGHGRLEFNLSPERVDIRCRSCGNMLPLPAATREDLQYILGLERLELNTNVYMPGFFRQRPGRRDPKSY